MTRSRRVRFLAAGLAALLVGGWVALSGGAQAPADKSPASELDTLLKGFEKVVSTSDSRPSMYTVYINKKDGQILAELPKEFATKKYFIALTVASGELYAGLQAGDLYVYWKQYGNRLARIEPDLETRSTGDQESKSSVNRLFTGNVIADVPILHTPPNRGPIISL